MQSYTIGDTQYTVEFRHSRRDSRYPSLNTRGAIRAITTCVVVGQAASIETGPPVGRLTFITSESVVCEGEDNFSRAVGREKSLAKTLRRCALFRKTTVPTGETVGSLLYGKWIQSYLLREKLRLAKIRKRKFGLSPEEIDRLAEAGRQTRLNRALSRLEVGA